MTEVVGIDPSLTSTGVAIRDETFVIQSKAKGMERLAEIRDAVFSELVELRRCSDEPVVVMVEGYARSWRFRLPAEPSSQPAKAMLPSRQASLRCLLEHGRRGADQERMTNATHGFFKKWGCVIWRSLDTTGRNETRRPY